jgi:parallel beta-helix repeat protein
MQKDNSLRIKKLIATLLLFFMITIAPVSADTMPLQSESSTMPFIYENTIYVDDDYNETTPGWGVDHFDNIQNAIGNASDGDAIYVYNGIYYENVVIDKRVNLTGEDKNTTIIDGSNTGNVVSIIITEVNVDGFTIRNSGYYSEDAGVYVGSYTNTITNNIITENQCGVYIKDAKSNNILESNITNCD